MEVEHFSTKIFSYHNKHDHLLWNPLNIHKWIDCVVLDDKLHWCHSRGCLCSMDYGLYQQIHLSKGHKINLYENTMTPLVFTDLLAHQWKCDWKQLWPWLLCCSGPGLKNAAPPCHLPTTRHIRKYSDGWRGHQAPEKLLRPIWSFPFPQMSLERPIKNGWQEKRGHNSAIHPLILSQVHLWLEARFVHARTKSGTITIKNTQGVDSGQIMKEHFLKC